ncbi:MAG: 16S rRNA (guanine(966)-N(2))-methyltransferase RsmD [Cellvibrionaceae bacterium]|nr:16S rRNA (guanine(966)-N(2))-methyltransferase RsmD [Cellvibrionaceae bacterium]MCV6626760.1 16S rRNA (guanine(966)-N(2))-methyltransferase RsmD [Cellvibrionaceae bacterium]
MAKPPQLRIIGGHWRGRKLAFAETEGLRPTGDRIRETLFNWLAADIGGSRCLDLFSGSGALGLEALSRGAAEVQLWEQNKRACELLSKHLQTLNPSARSQLAKVYQGDSISRLERDTPAAGFDIVFMDPPFSLDLWNRSAEALEKQGWLAEEALVYVESPKNQALQLPPNWKLWRQKQTGQVSFQLLERS